MQNNRKNNWLTDLDFAEIWSIVTGQILIVTCKWEQMNKNTFTVTNKFLVWDFSKTWVTAKKFDLKMAFQNEK